MKDSFSLADYMRMGSAPDMNEEEARLVNEILTVLKGKGFTYSEVDRILNLALRKLWWDSRYVTW